MINDTLQDWKITCEAEFNALLNLINSLRVAPVNSQKVKCGLDKQENIKQVILTKILPFKQEARIVIPDDSPYMSSTIRNFSVFRKRNRGAVQGEAEGSLKKQALDKVLDEKGALFCNGFLTHAEKLRKDQCTLSKRKAQQVLITTQAGIYRYHFRAFMRMTGYIKQMFSQDKPLTLEMFMAHCEEAWEAIKGAYVEKVNPNPPTPPPLPASIKI